MVTPEGLLEMDGATFDSPSGAGRAVLGRAVNGWSFWRLQDGGKLMDIRQKYLGTYVDRKALYESFWGEVLERIRAADPGWTQASASGNSWITLPFGTSDVRYVLAFTITGPTVDLDFASADRQVNVSEYEKFFVRRELIEEAFGEALSWEPLEDKKSCRIRASREAGGQITDSDQREELVAWFVTSALRLRSVTKSHVAEES